MDDLFLTLHTYMNIVINPAFYDALTNNICASKLMKLIIVKVERKRRYDYYIKRVKWYDLKNIKYDDSVHIISTSDKQIQYHIAYEDEYSYDERFAIDDNARKTLHYTYRPNIITDNVRYHSFIKEFEISRLMDECRSKISLKYDDSIKHPIKHRILSNDDTTFKLSEYSYFTISDTYNNNVLYICNVCCDVGKYPIFVHQPTGRQRKPERLSSYWNMQNIYTVYMSILDYDNIWDSWRLDVSDSVSFEVGLTSGMCDVNMDGNGVVNGDNKNNTNDVKTINNDKSHVTSVVSSTELYKPPCIIYNPPKTKQSNISQRNNKCKSKKNKNKKNSIDVKNKNDTQVSGDTSDNKIHKNKHKRKNKHNKCDFQFQTSTQPPISYSDTSDAIDRRQLQTLNESQIVTSNDSTLTSLDASKCDNNNNNNNNTSMVVVNDTSMTINSPLMNTNESRIVTTINDMSTSTIHINESHSRHISSVSNMIRPITSWLSKTVSSWSTQMYDHLSTLTNNISNIDNTVIDPFAIY